jgi:hypothetical protein
MQKMHYLVSEKQRRLQLLMTGQNTDKSKRKFQKNSVILYGCSDSVQSYLRDVNSGLISFLIPFGGPEKRNYIF